MLICDEPVSALDVSVRAQILNLLEGLKAEHGLTLLFIAHDLAVVRNVSDRVAVMYLGKLCEVGPADRVPRADHPYTRALIEAVPEPDPDLPIPLTALAGDLPSPLDPPSGCRFRTRWARAEARCAEVEPVLRRVTADGVDHVVACHYPLVDTGAGRHARGRSGRRSPAGRRRRSRPGRVRRGRAAGRLRSATASDGLHAMATRGVGRGPKRGHWAGVRSPPCCEVWVGVGEALR